VSDVADGGARRLRISVVIPSWRDAESLAVLVPALAKLERVAQVVIVDASADRRD
jgi:GT2 family glycosyltransferase